jgi:carbamoyl-phosphate synthase large subunit
VFLSLADRDKAVGLEAARQFAVLGFELAATSGTAEALERAGVPVATRVAKVGQSQPGMVDAVDLIAEGKVQLVVNTPRGRGPQVDGIHIRNAALVHQVPCLTTVAAARAAAAGITDWIRHPLSVRSLQEYHRPAEV